MVARQCGATGQTAEPLCLIIHDLPSGAWIMAKPAMFTGIPTPSPLFLNLLTHCWVSIQKQLQIRTPVLPFLLVYLH